ncbi:phosphorylase family protein [Sorangium sp. So ce406]|uniref:5'-methylthioadenosine/S-adenosylhomocysteine nucleosidase family protein n=1 Tax=Sorangium sp. So ce406 TaxID=3133311 RepID=UPI003F5C43E6
MTVGEEREQAEALAKRVRVGIVTALPEERAAMLAMFERTYHWSFAGQGAGLVYDLGVLPAHGGGCHVVALALAGMGNNVAAARGTLLLTHFPEVEAILMTGIAGGVPSPSHADDHVRLGDVVVSGERGVIQYDFVKKTRRVTEVRASPRPPHARLLEAVRLLESDALAGARPWEGHVERAKHLEGAARPEAARDVLLASQKPFERVEHPVDRKRTDGQPRIFKGPIASGNVLLKEPVWRDRLRTQHGAKAVEMEGSGIADATWEHGVGYLVVRGICDYCDKNKNDDWHMYAAVVAAAYTRAVLGRMVSGDEAETTQPTSAAAANREPPMVQFSTDTSPIWAGNNHPFEFRVREETATYTEMMRSLMLDVVKVHAHTHPVGVAAEHAWIRHNYPDSTMVTQTLVSRELTVDNNAKKRIFFDAIRIRLSGGREKDVWFDISSFFDGRSSSYENPGKFIAGKISKLYADRASGEGGASGAARHESSGEYFITDPGTKK